MITPTRFTLTEDHIKLVRHFNVDWNDEYSFGAPCVDLKRPYGNSSVANDICRLLTGEIIGRVDSKRDKLSIKEENKYLKIHSETAIALDIILTLGTFEPGTYERPQYEYHAWRKVK